MESRLLGNSYRLESQLGRRAAATLWAGVDLRDGQRIVVATLDGAHSPRSAAYRRLGRDARALIELNHPSIETIRDFGLDGGIGYVVTQPVTTRSVAALLAADGPMAVGQAVAIATQVCAALAAAHAAGVVHGDLDPSAVAIDPAGAVTVRQFGLVPGEATDPQVDMGALGDLLRAMAGEHAPGEFDRLVADLLATNPGDRPSAAQALQRLRQIDAPRRRTREVYPGSTVSRHRDPGGPSQWLRRNRVAVLSALAVLVGAVAVTAWLPQLDSAEHAQWADTEGPTSTNPPPVTTAAASTQPTAEQSTQTQGTETSLALLAAFTAAVQQQIDQGQLNPGAGRDLRRRLDEVAGYLGAGDTGKAREMLTEIDARLAELHRDGKLTDSGYAALNGVKQIIDSIPTSTG